jgi:hypothetical protein
MPGCLPFGYTLCRSRRLFYTSKALYPLYQHRMTAVLQLPKPSFSRRTPPPTRRNESAISSKRLQSQTKRREGRAEQALQPQSRAELNHSRLSPIASPCPWTRGLRHSQNQGQPRRMVLCLDPPRANCPVLPAFHLTHGPSVAKASQTVTTSARPYRRLRPFRYSQKNQRLNQETRRLCQKSSWQRCAWRACSSARRIDRVGHRWHLALRMVRI